MLICKVSAQASGLAFAFHSIPLALASAANGFLLSNEISEFLCFVFEFRQAAWVKEVLLLLAAWNNGRDVIEIGLGGARRGLYAGSGVEALSAWISG